jgi:hypothetical protein
MSHFLSLSLDFFICQRGLAETGTSSKGALNLTQYTASPEGKGIQATSFWALTGVFQVQETPAGLGRKGEFPGWLICMKGGFQEQLDPGT